MSFQSAWSPPVEAYRKMEELGFGISATYYESGCAFCGSYEEGCEDTYGIDGNSDWVKENIPSWIDDMYCISLSMSEWEEEQRVERIEEIEELLTKDCENKSDLMYELEQLKSEQEDYENA